MVFFNGPDSPALDPATPFLIGVKIKPSVSYLNNPFPTLSRINLHPLKILTPVDCESI